MCWKVRSWDDYPTPGRTKDALKPSRKTGVPLVVLIVRATGQLRLGSRVRLARKWELRLAIYGTILVQTLGSTDGDTQMRVLTRRPIHVQTSVHPGQAQPEQKFGDTEYNEIGPQKALDCALAVLD